MTTSISIRTSFGTVHHPYIMTVLSKLAPRFDKNLQISCFRVECDMKPFSSRARRILNHPLLPSALSMLAGGLGQTSRQGREIGSKMTGKKNPPLLMYGLTAYIYIYIILINLFCIIG